MDKSKKSQSKKSKLQEDVTPTFNSDLQKICSENQLNINVVCYILNADITAGLSWTTYPLILKPSPEIETEKIIIYIANDNFEKQGILNKLFIKHQKISITFLDALLLVFPKYDTFTTIKLEYCNLNSNDIEFLQTILLEFKNIIDLSLDGNPNSRQNYAVLLQDTHLKHLSLKRCKINEYGLKKLSLKLHYSPPNKLITLNLTGNYIDDNAIKHFAIALRENRKLRTINLADNWITDAGCYEIMKSLQRFILTHDEIIIKRKTNINYFKQRAQLIEEYKKQEAIKESKFKLMTESQKILERSNSLKASSKKSLKKESKLSRVYTSDSLSNEAKHLDYFIESNITKRVHPFVVDIIEKDGEVHCAGNMKLSYINLAYNKISYTGYKYIIDTLCYQISNDYLGAGLTFITLDGNRDLTSPEFYQIYKILMEKKLKISLYSNSKSTILNRRPSSKYSSIII